MSTIAKTVTEIIQQSPFLEEAIADKLINVSALARHIQAEVCNKSGREINEGAIVMAINRMEPGYYHKINLGIKKVIITLGEKGLFYSDGKEEIYLKASAVKAIDTTGAGDAFNGGLAFGLLKEKPIKECLELANKVAGISTTKLGAGDAMPFIQDIK